VAARSPGKRIGIVGPHRRREGTGRYVARFMHRAGARVVAVAAATSGSAAEAAQAMSAEFGYRVTPYRTPGAMMDRAVLDAVAICSPASRHEAHLTCAVNADISAFCEKPLIWSGRPGDMTRAAALAEKFEERRLILHHNTQWRFVLDDLVGLLGSERVFGTSMFEMGLAPPMPGLDMVPEAAPHPISLIVALGGVCPLDQLSANWSADRNCLRLNAIVPRLRREPLAVRIVLQVKRDQPRPAWIILDSTKIERTIASMSPYRLALRVGDAIIPIADPLERSVRSFLSRLERSDCGSDPQIRAEMAMLEEIWLQVAHR
jgi:hypothetical protein